MSDRAQLHERLELAVEQLASSQDFGLWLAARRYHRSYSFRNRILIMLQRPEATRVMGFKPWLKFGRCVSKGEHGIRILGPVKAKRTDEKTGRDRVIVVGFKEVSVFDISQTTELAPRPDGKPYLPLEPPPQPPTINDTKSADAAELAFSNSLRDAGVAVAYEPDAGESHGGYYVPAEKRIVVLARDTRTDQLRVLVHEAAHHHGATYEDLGRARAEVIADSAAWIVLAELGLAVPEQTFYIAHWKTQGTHSTLADQAAIDLIADTILAPLMREEEKGTTGDEKEPNSAEGAVTPLAS